MSNFDDELFKGYTSHTKNFDQWCQKAYPVLGKITQCTICEYDDSGHGFILGNREDYAEEFISKKGYLFDKDICYSAKFSHNLSITNDGNEKGLFDLETPYPALDVSYVINYRERVNKNTVRSHGFSSDSRSIHNAFANNIDVFKQFLKHFIRENTEIVDNYRSNKVNFAEIKEDYFIKDEIEPVSDRERTNQFLAYTGIIKKGEKITEKEWQCLQLYKRGYTATKSSAILGISPRTIEFHFESLKKKLGAKLKPDLIKII